MKKVLIILFFSGIGISQLNAQILSVGPKIGISQGDVQVSDGYSGDDSQMGYHVGIFARVNLSAVYIQPEFLYTNTGGSFKNNTFSYDADFDRLDVPLMLGLKLGNTFRIQAGPVASYLLNGDIKVNDGNSVQQIIPPTEDFTFGYQAGVGLDIGNLFLDLKYEGALTNSVNNYGEIPTDQRQSMVMLSLGFNLF
ncbi:porin family protein [Cyclobacterium qasimii]|uniref:Outer membrane protein beta-barrel domain-containing protein n=1 Tax=Cyclobacterium qasimii TaxID=1350429 RepID=A0A512CHL4_9BACT|nr:porin family protein [Cyclobacterium qasimii]GEO23702.1 hypothetical protein CQA01_42360 [Cyclobacterium qasimii]